MICGQPGGCGLELAPGSAHLNLESCCAALRACRVCGTEVSVIVHPGCAPRLVAQRGADAGSRLAGDYVQRKATEMIDDFLNPKEGKRKKRGRAEPLDP